MNNDELIEKLARIIAGDSYPLNEDFELAEECLALCRPVIERETRERCALKCDAVSNRINTTQYERTEWDDGYVSGAMDAATALKETGDDD